MLNRNGFKILSVLLLVVLSLSQNVGCDDVEQDGEDARVFQQGLQVCAENNDCASDEACTQGGHCVNVTGQRSATAALQADLDGLPRAAGLGVPYSLPPNARLLLDDPDGDGVALRIKSRVIFDGKGSLFRVVQNRVGLDLGPAMDWGSVKDLSIEPERPNEINDTIGIDVNAHGVRLDNLYFNRLGTGIRAHSSSQPPVTNLNVQQWSRLVFIRNFRYAIDMDGRDVNAGLLTGIEVKGGNGILDSSFLGNTYLAPMINGTAVDSITLDSTAGISLVLGAYLEWVAPDMTSRSLNDVHVGGTGIDRVRGPGDRIGVRSAYLNFRHPDNNMRVVIPGSTNAAFLMKHPQENAWWALRYFQSLSTLKWAFTVGDASKSVYRWTSTENPAGPALYDLGDPLFPDDGGGDNGGGGDDCDQFRPGTGPPRCR